MRTRQILSIIVPLLVLELPGVSAALASDRGAGRRIRGSSVHRRNLQDLDAVSRKENVEAKTTESNEPKTPKATKAPKEPKEPKEPKGGDESIALDCHEDFSEAFPQLSKPPAGAPTKLEEPSKPKEDDSNLASEVDHSTQLGSGSGKDRLFIERAEGQPEFSMLGTSAIIAGFSLTALVVAVSLFAKFAGSRSKEPSESRSVKMAPIQLSAADWHSEASCPTDEDSEAEDFEVRKIIGLIPQEELEAQNPLAGQTSACKIFSVVEDKVEEEGWVWRNVEPVAEALSRRVGTQSTKPQLDRSGELSNIRAGAVHRIDMTGTLRYLEPSPVSFQPRYVNSINSNSFERVDNPNKSRSRTERATPNAGDSSRNSGRTSREPDATTASRPPEWTESCVYVVDL